VSVDGVLASVDHSKLSKSMVLCFMMLWPDAGVRTRSNIAPEVLGGCFWIVVDIAWTCNALVSLRRWYCSEYQKQPPSTSGALFK